jgi:hypothetical protein
VALLILLIVAFKVLTPYREIPLNWLRHKMYPPQGGPSDFGKQILAENEKKEAARVETRYRRVLAMLEQARAEGHDTSGLEAKARAALSLNVDAYRRKAVKMLTEVEMASPRRRVQYIPMGPTQAPGEEIDEDVKPQVVQDEEAPLPAKPAPKKRKRKGRAR